jgi:L-lysine exporter family protein LysE/ArgO
MLITLASYFGALFLIVYGLLAFKRAFSPSGLQAGAIKKMTVLVAITTTAALSLLNPHVYLDTVILLGSIGGQLPGEQPLWFALGASVASVLWFSTLVIGGKMLAPWFESEKSWQKLDFLIGATMWVIALFLLASVL